MGLWRILLVVPALWVAVPARAEPTVTVRLFVDLECPHSRAAWPRWREATRQSGAQLWVHHVPLSQHPLARPAAIAALAARAQGRELEFLDALFAQPRPDEPAIAQAASIAGLEATPLAHARQAVETARQLDAERQGVLAFGISATPSALVNGVGVGTVPTSEYIAATLRRSRQAQAKQLPGDVERQGLWSYAPDFLPAFDNLRASRAGSMAPLRQGTLGPKYRVPWLERDVHFGRADAPVVAVVLLDPSQSTQRQQLRQLLAWTTTEPLQVVVKPVPRLDAGGSLDARADPLAGWLVAAAMVDPDGAAKWLAQVAASGGPPSSPAASAAAAGLDTVRIGQVMRSAEFTPALWRVVELQVRTRSRPGTVFFNGRPWQGTLADPNLPAEIAQAAETTKRALGAKTMGPVGYAALVADGQWLADTDLDLQPAADPCDSRALPSWGHGPHVRLFVDFASPHSRAAFFMLQQRGGPAVQMQLVPLHASHASASAYLAAAALGQGASMASRLFQANTPDDAATVRTLAAQLRFPRPAFQAAQTSAATRAALATAATCRAALATSDDPVVYLDRQLYVGPLDQARLNAALQTLGGD